MDPDDKSSNGKLLFFLFVCVMVGTTIGLIVGLRGKDELPPSPSPSPSPFPSPSPVPSPSPSPSFSPSPSPSPSPTPTPSPSPTPTPSPSPTPVLTTYSSYSTSWSFFGSACTPTSGRARIGFQNASLTNIFEVVNVFPTGEPWRTRTIDSFCGGDDYHARQIILEDVSLLKDQHLIVYASLTTTPSDDDISFDGHTISLAVTISGTAGHFTTTSPGTHLDTTRLINIDPPGVEFPVVLPLQLTNSLTTGGVIPNEYLVRNAQIDFAVFTDDELYYSNMFNTGQGFSTFSMTVMSTT